MKNNDIKEVIIASILKLFKSIIVAISITFGYKTVMYGYYSDVYMTKSQGVQIYQTYIK